MKRFVTFEKDLGGADDEIGQWQSVKCQSRLCAMTTNIESNLVGQPSP
jgi:hypothetical protein